VTRSSITWIAVGVLIVGAAAAALILSGDPDRPGGEEDPPEARRSIGDPAEIEAILRGGRQHPTWRDLKDGKAELTSASADLLFRIIADRDLEMVLRHHAILLLVEHEGAKIGERLVEAMKGPPRLEEPLLRAVLMVLEHRQDRDQAEALVAMAADPETEGGQIELFARTVGGLGVEVSLDPLLEIARGAEDSGRRAYAAIGIHLTRGPGVSPEVERILREDPDQGVRTELINAIHRRRDPEGRRFLVSLLTDETLPLEERSHTARILDDTRDPEALAGLEKVVIEGSVPEEVLLAAARSLGTAAPRGMARKVRAGLVRGRPEAVRMASAIALRHSRDRDGLADVRRALAPSEAASPRLRAELALALGELGGRADRVQLETLREDDPDPDVRAAAEKALTRLDEILMSEPDR